MTDLQGTARASATQTFARYGLAACAVLYGLLTVLALVIQPAIDYTAEGGDYVQAFSANIDAMTPSLWIWPALIFVGVPALLAVGRVARSQAPAIGLVGLILGFGVVLPSGLELDEVTYAAIKSGLDVESTVALLQSVEQNVPSSNYSILWFPGLVGLLLLGVAMLRGRSVPKWVGISLIIAPIAIPVTYFSGISMALIAAWMVLAAGFIGAAFVLVRRPTVQQANEAAMQPSA